MKHNVLGLFQSIFFWNFRALGLRRDLSRDEQWFQQDGASPHTSARTLEWLQGKFQDRIVSRRCDVEWAPHSPDLSPLDFHLWGYLKGRVYRHSLQTIPDLKEEITKVMKAIPIEQVQSVIDGFQRQIQWCRVRKGSHFEQLF